MKKLSKNFKARKMTIETMMECSCGSMCSCVQPGGNTTILAPQEVMMYYYVEASPSW